MRNEDTYIEHTHTHRHLVCWKSTLAGLAVAIVVFLGALALSLAFGGIGLSDGSSAKAAGTFAAGSLIIATILAAFSGGYLASRLGRTEVDALGTTQGLIVGAVFLIVVVCQITSAAGSLGKVAGQYVGSAVNTVESAANSTAENRANQDVVQTADAMKATGWMLFVVTVLGMSFSGLGGLLATKCNEKYTLDTHDDFKKDYKRRRV